MLPGFEKSISTLLEEMRSRTMRGHPHYYAPFQPEESAALRRHHAAQIERLNLDPNLPLKTKAGELIATGFTRIVVGDYGAYIEIAPGQMRLENIVPKFKQAAPSRPVKYIWLTTQRGDAKIYHQQASVKYADYRPGMYYIAPNEVQQS